MGKNALYDDVINIFYPYLVIFGFSPRAKVFPKEPISESHFVFVEREKEGHSFLDILFIKKKEIFFCHK